MASAMKPFLEIVTRACKRPTLLARNQLALAEQTSGDWRQTLLHDEEGRGIAWSHANMAAYGPQLVGDYIWILDDDDVCIRPTLVAELQEIVARHDPDVIMLRMDHGPLGILPDDAHWGGSPVCGYVGVSAFVVRRAVWQQHAGAWLPGRYVGDYDFIAAIFAAGHSVVWHDVIASQVTQIGRGRPEVDCAG